MEGAQKAVLQRIDEVRSRHRRLHWIGGALLVVMIALIAASLMWADGDGIVELLGLAVPLFLFIGALDLFRTEQVKDLRLLALSFGEASFESSDPPQD